MGEKEGEGMFCKYCGKEFTDGNFCMQCGARLEEQMQEEVFPEAGTAEFEARRAELVRRRIPHCPECLSTHVRILGTEERRMLYATRYVCMWCHYEWWPNRRK